MLSGSALSPLEGTWLVSWLTCSQGRSDGHAKGMLVTTWQEDWHPEGSALSLLTHYHLTVSSPRLKGSTAKLSLWYFGSSKMHHTAPDGRGVKFSAVPQVFLVFVYLDVKNHTGHCPLILDQHLFRALAHLGLAGTSQRHLGTQSQREKRPAGALETSHKVPNTFRT